MTAEKREILLMRSYATLPSFFQSGPCNYGQRRSGNTGEKIYLGIRGRNRIGDLMIADSFKQADSDLSEIYRFDNPGQYAQLGKEID